MFQEIVRQPEKLRPPSTSAAPGRTDYLTLSSRLGLWSVFVSTPFWGFSLDFLCFSLSCGPRYLGQPFRFWGLYNERFIVWAASRGPPFWVSPWGGKFPFEVLCQSRHISLSPFGLANLSHLSGLLLDARLDFRLALASLSLYAVLHSWCPWVAPFRTPIQVHL